MHTLGRGLILIISVLLVLQLGARWPQSNWDMVGYVASAYHKDGLRGQQLLQQTYADVRRQVDDATYNELLLGGYPEYRSTIAKDPEALEQQVPFYSIRVAYIETIRLLGHTNIPYAKATHWVSVFFAVLGILTLALICQHFRLPMMVVPIVTLAASHPVLASLSTPDAMACFFALLATWFLLKGHIVGIVFATLLPLLRTDYVILSSMMLAYRLYTGPRTAALIGLLATLALYVALNSSHEHYGWLTVFNFTFFNYTPYPRDIEISSQISDYVRVYLEAGQNLLGNRNAVTFFLAILLLMWQPLTRRLDDTFFLLLVIPTLYLGARLALFPLLQDRFFIFSSSLVLIWITIQLRATTLPLQEKAGR